MIEQTLSDMFVLSIPWLEKILRPIIVYGFLVISLRFAGKREMAQLNPFDLVVLLTLSNTVQNAIIGDDNSITGGVIGVISLLAVNYLVVRLTYQNRTLEKVIEGEADPLVDKGHINRKRLAEELISVHQLLSAAQKQGFESLNEVDRAVLEPSGTVIFTAKQPTPDMERHQELLDRLDRLQAEVAALRGAAGV